MPLKISNISRLQPESNILYRLRYRCEVNGARISPNKPIEAFFVSEQNALGEKSISWDFENLPKGLTEAEREEALGILQALGDNEQLDD